MQYTRQKLLLITSVVAIIFLMVYPCKVLLADYYFRRAGNILNDARFDNPNTAEISEATLPAYREAIECLRKSTRLVPSRSDYRKTLSDIYFRLGKWTSVMKITETALPAEAISAEEAFKNAQENIRIAIVLNPLNADYHLASSQFYRIADRDNEKTARELDLAIEAAPMNAALRYEVALQYLLLGNKEKALEHSRMLAHMDESYRVHYDSPSAGTAPRRDAWYVSRLAGSYLSKSMEIVWRASGKKADPVRSIVPDNPDAQQALLLFLERKGIE